jgi:hypothetical protein
MNRLQSRVGRAFVEPPFRLAHGVIAIAGRPIDFTLPPGVSG